MKKNLVKILSLSAALVLTVTAVLLVVLLPHGTKEAEQPSTVDEGVIITEPYETSGVSVKLRRLTTDEYRKFGIKRVASSVQSVYQLTATVLPAETTFPECNIAVGWADPSSEWANGKSVSDYMTYSKYATNNWTLQVTEAFGEKINIVVTTGDYVEGDTSEINAARRAVCVADYVKRINSASLEISFRTQILPGENTMLKTNLNNPLGTVSGVTVADGQTGKVKYFMKLSNSLVTYVNSYLRGQGSALEMLETEYELGVFNVGYSSVIFPTFRSLTRHNEGANVTESDYVAMEGAVKRWINQNPTGTHLTVWSEFDYYYGETMLSPNGRVIKSADLSLKFDSSFVTNTLSVTLSDDNIAF